MILSPTSHVVTWPAERQPDALICIQEVITSLQSYEDLKKNSK